MAVLERTSREVRSAAERILKLLAKQPRPVRYHDFVLLMQSRGLSPAQARAAFNDLGREVDTDMNIVFDL